jgi:hypothetical protein
MHLTKIAAALAVLMAIVLASCAERTRQDDARDCQAKGGVVTYEIRDDETFRVKCRLP